MSVHLRSLGFAACCGGLVWALADVGAAQDVPYGIGSWPEEGRGNHRALVRVAEVADAVRVHITWRRRDRDPETKDIRVYDSATGARVTNTVRISVTREAGDLAFQPATAPGTYEVYYLPYSPGKGNFDDPGTYFAPEDTADPAWLERSGLTPDALATGAWRSLPEARVVEIQARTEFDRMDPMEVIATEAETRALLDAHPDQIYLLFPEDRARAVRMYDELPLRWIRVGPSTEFEGDPQPGEYYVFQIAVWAARQPVTGLSLGSSDFSGPDGRAISASELHCINLGGTDWLGRQFTRTFEVGVGRVRPLWIGLQIPENASGAYSGTVEVRPDGLPASTVTVRLNVAGPVLEGGGDSDLWRLSRLRWLDSTLALDDDVIPPFTPLEVEGPSVRCIGRSVTFGESGLPTSITSGGREILAGPISLRPELTDATTVRLSGSTERTKVTPGTVDQVTKGDEGPLEFTTTARMEFDGCVSFTTVLKARADVDLRDVKLGVPIRRDVATYMMGLARRGGIRPHEWSWKWDTRRADNMVWLGDVDAGLQVKLACNEDIWAILDLADFGLPESWDNGGRGGCTVTQEGDTVLVRGYSGERHLAAGESLEFRYRLLITPLKPIDPNHWNWRYGDVHAGGTVFHLHHGTPENPYINYPFITADKIAALVQQVKSVKGETLDRGDITYPAAGNLSPDRGALHIWARVCFDPTAGTAGHAEFNRQLCSIAWPNHDELGFYWNIDDRGMRAYVRNGPPERNEYPALLPTAEADWKQGDRHLLTLSWGDRLAVFADGRLMGQAPLAGTVRTPLEGAVMRLSGDWAIEAVKITASPYEEGTTVAPELDEHTLFLDSFADWDGGRVSRPEKAAEGTVGSVGGTCERAATGRGAELVFSSRYIETRPKGLNIYYTVRELSNHVAEMWPLRSLGDEVFSTGHALIYSDKTAVVAGGGGGYPWLREHLVSGYVPAWRQPLPDGMDAAIATQGLSRWHNYYVEGMRWLMRHTGVDGLYLDGIGYDREIMKRIAKVMARTSPASRIQFHSGNNYDYLDTRVSPMNQYMEHLPYMSNLWFGEGYDYNSQPDFWLVEISGIPFGLTSEMLEYSNGGNPYRAMIYGMSGRFHPSAPAMWRFWDEFGIQDSEMIGYWSPRCPVRTDRPGVLATVYRKAKRSLIALADWSEADSTTREVRLTIDWAALGIDPTKARLVAPEIDHFQPAAEFASTDPIPVEEGKGCLLVVEEG